LTVKQGENMNYHLVYTLPGQGGQYVTESLIRKLGRKNGSRFSAELFQWGAYSKWRPTTPYDVDKFLRRLQERVDKHEGQQPGGYILQDVVITGPGLIHPANFFEAFPSLENQKRYYVAPAEWSGQANKILINKNAQFLNNVNAYRNLRDRVANSKLDETVLSSVSAPFRDLVSKYYQNLSELGRPFVPFESWALDESNEIVVNSVDGKPLRHSDRNIKIAIA